MAYYISPVVDGPFDALVAAVSQVASSRKDVDAPLQSSIMAAGK